MALISQDYISKLWNEMKTKSWSNLRNLLQNKAEGADGIEKNMIDALLSATNSLSRKPFPKNPEDLSQMLNDEVAHGKSILSDIA